MASLYKRKRSPFWWIKYRDAFTGKIVRQSTSYKIAVGPQTRLARALEAEKNLAELSTQRVQSGEAWDNWVTPFIESHYAQSSGSRSRFLSAWKTIRLFLREFKIHSPRNVTRQHCSSDYFVWRKTPDVQQGKYRAGHNTTLLEMKIFAILMKEAIRRGYTRDNPARELGIKRAPRREYPEYTDEALTMIFDAIAKEPEPRRTFFLNSFLIARWHGVRLSETFLNPQTQVWQQEIQNQTRWVILFHQKGGRQKPKLLHPELIPLIRQLKQSGAVQTYERPDKPSRVWFDFLKRCGIKAKWPNACFHSLRVTAASRLARAGVSERKAMEYLTHASTTIHQAYIRWRPEDMDECHGAL